MSERTPKQGFFQSSSLFSKSEEMGYFCIHPKLPSLAEERPINTLLKEKNGKRRKGCGDRKHEMCRSLFIQTYRFGWEMAEKNTTGREK